MTEFQETKTPTTLICQFTKDDTRTITYMHTPDNEMFFKISGYPDGDSTITVNGPNSMNFLMNLLAAAGYDSNEVII